MACQADLSTGKPLYQPGQTAHVRFNGKNLILREIPEKLRLRDYEITVALADKDQDTVASLRLAAAEIMRYQRLGVALVTFAQRLLCASAIRLRASGEMVLRTSARPRLPNTWRA